MNEALQNILGDRNYKINLIEFLEKNPNLFDEAITISLGNVEPQAWRATWLVEHFTKQNDKRVKPHIKSILKVIKEKEDGHQREFLRILLKMKLSKKKEGILFDTCITIWEDINKSPSVRILAFSILVNIAEKYPELIKEIEFLTQNHYSETLSQGIKKSFEKMKNDLLNS